jgi:hypothetical protein
VGLLSVLDMMVCLFECLFRKKGYGKECVSMVECEQRVGIVWIVLLCENIRQRRTDGRQDFCAENTVSLSLSFFDYSSKSSLRAVTPALAEDSTAPPNVDWGR